MKKLLIGEQEKNQRIDKFLGKSFFNFPISHIYKDIRKKNIKVNGKRCAHDYILKLGDTVDLFVKDEFLCESPYKYEFLKAPFKLDVIYEDENIIIMNKPVGLICHQDKNYHFDCLLFRLRHYLYLKKEYDPRTSLSFSPALVNRLDRNTGGLIIAAKNNQSLKTLNKKIKNREIKKFYLCIVEGIPKKDFDSLTAYINKNEKTNMVVVRDKPSKLESSKLIITNYKVLKKNSEKNISLLLVELVTGRTHQIRAHLAYIGLPIVGDKKYGKKIQTGGMKTAKSQVLYSYKLIFDFCTDAGALNYLKDKSFKIDPSDIEQLKI